VVAMEPVKVIANSATMANVMMKMIIGAPSISAFLTACTGPKLGP
jgi:hypothetical protein